MPRPAAPLRCNPPPPAPRCWRGRSRSAAAYPRSGTAAARMRDARAPSSRRLPGGPVLGVLQHDAERRELITDAVGLGEVLLSAGIEPRRDAQFDLLRREAGR